MQIQIITVVIKSEYDLILARQRAKQIANLSGLSFTDQTRFVTGVSEISRNAVMYGNGGKVEFSINDIEGFQYLQAKVIDNGTKKLDSLVENTFKSTRGMGIGINGTRNLMDYFSIDSSSEKGNIVTLAKKIPDFIPAITCSIVNDWSRELLNDEPKSFFEEIQQQNQVLMATLEKLEEKEEDLRKQLDKTMRLNSELENANQELKDFAYIVSHDLKAPLRGISSLAGWIATDYADKLDDDGSKMIDMLLGRIQRMNNLIDGILQYSRVGRIKEDKVLIKLNDLIMDIIHMISPPENISIKFNNQLPEVIFEETRINQVFQNLIGNAVKYMDKKDGLILVGSEDEGSHWKFYVYDNGPGIEEKYFEKIFKIFQTLNPRDKIEGTGVGLTIVKKIIELYGGKIWLESKPDSGTTFFFTLPKNIV